MNKYIDYLVKWLQDKVKLAHADGLIVGVSGGIDSAVVACLIKKAFPDNSMGLIMPCFSKQEDVVHGLLVVEKIGLEHQIINLDKTFECLMTEEVASKIDKTERYNLAQANTKARLRMTSMYAVAQNYNYLVCGTDNACEWFTGYFTKFGDGGVDIAPLVQLMKSEVYEMARILGIDESIINKPPSAGLVEEQTDEMEMQVTYQELEVYLAGKKVSKQAQERIEYLHYSSEHKRNIVDFPLKKVSDLV